MELARFLRERKVNASIIYITDYPGFALDSFSVSPLEYPLKPVDEWRLAAALDWARQQKRPVLRVGGRAIFSGRDHLSSASSTSGWWPGIPAHVKAWVEALVSLWQGMPNMTL